MTSVLLKSPETGGGGGIATVTVLADEYVLQLPVPVPEQART
jgi:hypothetical protein